MNCKDNNHSYWECFKEKVYAMKERGDLCDVALRTDPEPEDGKAVFAHRLVLAANSSYFYGMFCHHLKENDMKEITLKGVTMSGLKAVIEFLYTRILTITQQSVESILYAANLFQIKEVEDRCCQYLRENITMYNCLGIMRVSEALGMSKLNAFAGGFCLKNFSNIVKEEEFVLMPIDTVLYLLRHDSVTVPREKVIYEAGMKWILHDKKERSKYLIDVLKAVRLSSIDLEFLRDEMKFNLLIQDQDEAKEMIASAMDFSRLSPSDKIKCSKIALCKPRDASKLANRIVAFGGRSTNASQLSREVLDFDSNTWRPISGGKKDCYACTSVSLGGSIYVVGGCRDTKSSSHCYSFTKDHDTYREAQAPSMNTPRSYHGSAVSYSRIYAVGGLQDTKRLTSVEVLSVESSKWAQVKELPYPLQYSALCSHNDLICCVGGHDGRNRMSSVLCYDQQINSWTNLKSIGEPRSLSGVASLDGRLFVIGGFDGEHYLSKVEALDSREGKWQVLPMLQGCRAAFGISILYGMIYVSGGFNGSFLSSTEYYDARKNQWFKGNDMNCSRAHFSMAAI